MTALFVAKREIEIDPDKRESARVRVTQKVVDQRRRVRKGRPHPRKPIMRRRHTDRGDNPDPGIQLKTQRVVDERRAIRQRTHFGHGPKGQSVQKRIRLCGVLA